MILIGGLWRPQTVTDAGGSAADLPGHMVTEIYPSFLPDGRHYVATRSSTGVWLGSIDDPGERRILPDVSNAQVVAPPSGPVGAVILTRAGTLTALPFDLKRLEATGEPYPVAEGVVARSFTPKSLASTSSAGLLAWVSGEGRNWQYVWRNRQGKDLGSAGEAGSDVRISPDGKRVLGDHLSGGLWVLEFATGVSTRLGFDAANMSPVWSPDGKYVAWFRSGGIYREAVNAAGKKQLLLIFSERDSELAPGRAEVSPASAALSGCSPDIGGLSSAESVVATHSGFAVALSEVKDELRRRMHDPIPEVGQWLRAVVGGHIRYYGVPMNSSALGAFRLRTGLLWHQALSRRSQTGHVRWDRMRRLIDRWLPTARVHHPYPLRRMRVIT